MKIIIEVSDKVLGAALANVADETFASSGEALAAFLERGSVWAEVPPLPNSIFSIVKASVLRTILNFPKGKVFVLSHLHEVVALSNINLPQMQELKSWLREKMLQDNICKVHDEDTLVSRWERL